MLNYYGYTPNLKESESYRKGSDFKNKNKKRLVTDSEREIF